LLLLFRFLFVYACHIIDHVIDSTKNNTAEIYSSLCFVLNLIRKKSLPICFY